MNLLRRTGVSGINSSINTPIHRYKRRKFIPQYSYNTDVKGAKMAFFTPKISILGVI